MTNYIKQLIIDNYIILVFSLLIVAIVSCKDIENEENESISFQLGKRQKEILFNFKKIKEPENERIVKRIKLKSKLKFGGIKSDLFEEPSQIKIDNDSNIFVLDNSACTVKKFNKHGIFIKKFGSRGRGPGEFENAFDFDIYNNKIVVVSPNHNKFSVFENDNVYDFKPINMATNLCFAGESEVAVLQVLDPIGISPIRKINYMNDEISDYQNILNINSMSDQTYGMLPFLIGDVHSYNNRIIYISQILGYVVVYNNKMEIDYTFRLLASQQNIELLREEKGGFPLVRFPRQNEYLFLFSNIHKDLLYVQVNDMKANEEGKYLIDVYSIPQGKYLHTMELEHANDILSIFCTNTEIYIIKKDTEIEVFDYSLYGDSN